jgi:hypothetical protein
MQLHPAVSVEQAHEWLCREATAAFGTERTPELEQALTPFAQAMAAVSAVELPDDLEPEFP